MPAPIESFAGSDHVVVRAPDTAPELALRLPRIRAGQSVEQARRDAAAFGAATGLGPRLHFHDASSGVSILEWMHGEALTPQRIRTSPQLVSDIGRSLRQIHSSEFDLTSRVSLPRLVSEMSAGFPDHDKATGRLMVLASRIEATAGPAVPSHGDPVAANFIQTRDGLRMIDWDYAAMHDPCWDLAYVITENGLDQNGTEALLSAYGGGVSPDRLLVFRALVAGINAGWKALRGTQDAALAMAFAQALAAHPQVDAAARRIGA